MPRATRVSSPKRAPAKNPTAKKPTAKNPTAKNPTAKNPTAKNPTAKKPTAKRPTAKRPAPARAAARGKVARTLPGATKGKASAAAAAVGDAPVRAYIASLPAAQRAICKRFDALIAATLPGIQRCIKWGMAFYGAEAGWFVSCGGFADHVKITFLHGASLLPVPPVGTGKYTRGVDVVRAADLDTAQLAEWIRQGAKLPGLGKRRR